MLTGARDGYHRMVHGVPGCALQLDGTEMDDGWTGIVVYRQKHGMFHIFYMHSQTAVHIQYTTIQTEIVGRQY